VFSGVVELADDKKSADLVQRFEFTPLVSALV